MEKIISSDANDPYNPDTHYMIQKPKTILHGKENKDKVINSKEVKEHREVKEVKELKESKDNLKEVKEKEKIKISTTLLSQGPVKNTKTIIPLSTKNDTKPKIFQNIQINLKSSSPKPVKKDKTSIEKRRDRHQKAEYRKETDREKGEGNKSIDEQFHFFRQCPARFSLVSFAARIGNHDRFETQPVDQ